MSNTILLRWDRSIPGREMEANELFSSAMAYLNRQMQGKKIESFEPVLVGAHGGWLNGFFLIRGKPDQLDVLRRNDEFIDLTMRAQYVLQRFGVHSAHAGDAVQDVMQRWAKLIRP